MAMVEINWNPSRKELQVFAALQFVFFSVVAAIVFHKHHATTAALTIAAVSALIGIIGCIVPQFIRWIYVVWMVAVFPIGFVISYLVLAAVYYLVLTPIGLVMRICGKDPMQRSFASKATTYWTQRMPDRDGDQYFRQY